jgi:hypothetical protein
MTPNQKKKKKKKKKKKETKMMSQNLDCSKDFKLDLTEES